MPSSRPEHAFVPVTLDDATLDAFAARAPCAHRYDDGRECGRMPSHHRTRERKRARSAACGSCGKAPATREAESQREPERRPKPYADWAPETKARHVARNTRWKNENPDKVRGYRRKQRDEELKDPFHNRDIIGIDGEGYTDPKTGEHFYTYMAASTSTRLVAEISASSAARRLTTDEIFQFLLRLPQKALLFGFSLGYDRTKWFEDLPPWVVYYLFQPEMRQGDHGPMPVKWMSPESGTEFKVNLLSTKFSVKGEIETDGEHMPQARYARRSTRGTVKKRRAVVWDLFKFYQCAFITALERWEVGTEEERAAILAMKERRGGFDWGITEQEKEYCRSECRLLAVLAEKLITAHADAGLELASYYGPGSTASLMLKRMGAKEQKARMPARMREAAETAFFGGRFEQTLVGPVREKIHGRDIASAYPYAIFKMPCLRHGRWKHFQAGRSYKHGPVNGPGVHGKGHRQKLTERDLWQKIESSPAACVRFKLPAYSGMQRAVWGPLPHRQQDGNIVFPIAGPGGWAWRDEVLAARRFAPNVAALSAWIFLPSPRGCSCGRPSNSKRDPMNIFRGPFASAIARYYVSRLEWGKNGKGIVMKLGLNSCYGKRAQRIGKDPPYQCIVAAGMITSHARAQILDAIVTTFNANAISVATDGVLFRGRAPKLAAPVDTGTLAASDAATARTGKLQLPLGAWEPKDFKHGVFLLRPGLRFSLDPETKRSDTAARGLGVHTLHKNRQFVLDEWEKAPMTSFTIQQPDLFHGAKSSTRRLERKDETGKSVVVRDDVYGKWVTPEPRKVGYEATPKRASAVLDRKTKEWKLLPWIFDPDTYPPSCAYGDAPRSALADGAREFEEFQDEQPDGAGIAVFENGD